MIKKASCDHKGFLFFFNWSVYHFHKKLYYVHEVNEQYYYLDAVVVSILYDGIEQWFSDKGKLEKEGLVSLFLVCFLVIYLSVIPFLSNIQYLFVVFLL